MYRIFISLLLLSTLVSCQQNTGDQAEEIIDSKRLGQMLIVGFRGTEVDSKHSVIRDLKELNVGGVILYDYDYGLETFNRNIESQDQLLKLSSDLISNASTPPIIVVHQDGSVHSPLDELYPDALSPFSKSFLQDSASTVSYSRKFAREFMVLGLNTNFNPRLDLKTPTDQAPVPGILSSDPELVVRQANYILDEYDTEQIFSVPKYFPGYSSNYNPTDSADNVTDVWTEDFIKPYHVLLAEREIGGIMTAHSFNANIDSVWPGTLSGKTINGLLRDSLGFDGVIISDDLQKPIISSKYDMETAVARAINAGVDILLIGNNFDYDKDIAGRTINTIQKLLKEGRIQKETIEASLSRIDSLKTNVIADLCTCFNF